MDRFKYFDKDGIPFKFDREDLKLFRMSGDKLLPVSEPDKGSKILNDSVIISESEALKLASSVAESITKS